MTSTIIKDKTRTSIRNPDTKYDGYFTIKLRPIVCGCGKVMEFVEADERHVIIVWEEMDDDNLLASASELKRLNLNPKIIEYQSTFGHCIDFYEAVEKGWVGNE